MSESETIRELRERIEELEEGFDGLLAVKALLMRQLDDADARIERQRILLGETTVEDAKITLEEVEKLLTAIVDYNDVLKRVGAPDPVRGTIIHIFEKYNIKITTMNVWDGIPDLPKSTDPEEDSYSHYRAAEDSAKVLAGQGGFVEGINPPPKRKELTP